MNYLILFGAMVGLFYKAFYCGYVVDDVVMVKTMKAWKEQFNRIGIIRFLQMACYGGGLFNNAKQEYAFTLMLHYINCCLIYHMSGSFMGALLYLVNPINNQTSLWMNGRRYALTILSVLLIWNWKWLGFILFPFCTAIHVGGLFEPFLFAWTPWWPLIPIGLGIGYLMYKKNMHSRWEQRKSEFKKGNENQNITPKKLILYIKSVGYNFINCILPLKPAMYHNFLFYFSNDAESTAQGYSFNLEFYKGLTILSFLGYMIIWQHNFWAFWFLLFISGWCNLYQVTMNASDRYCSLANVGAMLLLSELVNKLPHEYSTPIFVGLITLYVIKYQPLFRAYTSEENFYLYHLNQQPDLVNPRYYLAKFYLDHNDIYSAFAIIKKGLQYRPYDFKFLLMMMEIMFQMGKIEAGLQVMKVCEKCCPDLEKEDCKVFFDGLKVKFKRHIEEIAMRDNMRSRNVHNSGQPIRK